MRKRRDDAIFGRQNNSLVVVLEEMMRERGTKESSIDGDRSEFGNIDLFTSWAVDL